MERLGDVVEVAAGQAAPPSGAFCNTGIPFVRAGSVDRLMSTGNWDRLEKLDERAAKAHKMKLFPENTVVFAKSGMSAALARVFKTDRPAYIVSHLAALKPNGKADPNFLAHWLEHYGTDKLIKDPAYPSIRLSDIEEMPFPKLPLPEQRRIAGILDQADALRRLRRQSLSRLSDLGQAIFHEMFEDRASADWPKMSIADVVDHDAGGIRTGPFGSQLLHSEFVDSGIAVLGIDNAVSNTFRWAKERFITAEKYAKLSRYKVYPGDVLITIMGTCGRCAIVPEDVGEVINTKHLCCISLQKSRCLPQYLHSYFLYHQDSLQYLGVRSKGAIMDGLNGGLIKAMPLTVPPIELQQQFVKKLKLIEANEREFIAADERAWSLFNSLQHRAFRGEL